MRYAHKTFTPAQRSARASGDRYVLRRELTRCRCGNPGEVEIVTSAGVSRGVFCGACGARAFRQKLTRHLAWP